MSPQIKRVGIWIVGGVRAKTLAQKRINVKHLRPETLRTKHFFHARHAEKVPMIFIERPCKMLRAFIHLEKTGA